MIGTTLNQRFTLEKELGRGGMGAVYRATDQILQRAVAIKILKEHSGDEVSRRIRLEAQILARLLHDNVVRLYDFGESAGTYFLVMEEVDGTSFLKRWRHIELPERLRVVAQVAEALDYAHHQGVIHRDVKPANVLLTASDQPKLSDFGLSLVVEQVQANESGTIRGTPHYMSPEQAQGKRLDHRSDLYSLGVMLYECATGLPPFVGATMAIIAQHTNATPAAPRAKCPELSAGLDALILALLAKSPDARPHSGQAVAQALREEAERGPAAPATATVNVGTDEQAVPVDSPTAVVPVVVAATPPSTPSLAVPTGLASPAGELLSAILAEPIILTADERYLCGHYLAYLLGGSRRQGFLLRRPLDPRNADRARLLLGMTAAMYAGGTPESIARVAELLEKRQDVRPALNPVVVMKYLYTRATVARRKKFREVRQQLLDASPYARKHLTDPNGLLNPGLMPQKLDDLRKLAPERTDVDDLLVERWNRVAEVWRDAPGFRDAVLRYATLRADRDPASADLWPEVVYPLIERARWQRRFRPQHEKLWDYLAANVLRRPDAGVRLDRAIRRSVPERVVDELDVSLADFTEDPELGDEVAAPAASPARDEDRLTMGGGVSLHELADRAPETKDLDYLINPDPTRFTQGELSALWQEALASMRRPGAKAGHRHVPVGGPYRLAVIPSVRGRSAGQVVIQGMPNKQIEMLTPSLRGGGPAGRPLVAVWVWQDGSLATAYLDFQNSERYIFWHAPNAQQFNYENAADLNHMLFSLGLEGLDQVDKVLSKRFRPKNPV